MKKIISKIETAAKKAADKFKKFDSKVKLGDKLYKVLMILTILWFIYQMFFFAYNIKYNAAPDEERHRRLIVLYSERDNLSPFFPEQTDNFQFGDLTRNPSYLYFYIMGLFLKIPIVFKYHLIFLRITSIVTSLGIVYFFIKTMDELTKNRFVKLASVFMFTNTIMVPFLGMAVTYDNLVNLMAVISFYLLTRLFKSDWKSKASQISSLWLLIWWVINSCLASIVKYTYTPLFFIEAVVVGIFLMKNYENLIKSAKDWWNSTKLHIKIPVVILLLISIVLFVERYSVNISKYGNPYPDCAKIHELEDCFEFNAYKRNWELAADPMEKTQISIPGYAVYWSFYMLNRTYGIFGHTPYIYKNNFMVYSIVAVVGMAFLAFVRLFDKDKTSDRQNLPFIIFTIFYIFVLFYFKNYAEQKIFGLTGLAVHGRYIFPVYPLGLYFINHYLTRFMKSNLLQLIWLLCICFLFVYGQFAFFIRNAGEEWFRYGEPRFVVNFSDESYFKNAADGEWMGLPEN
ncbi:hypothetical protein GF357_03555 [Candidatus Dojkabacteria bacterium]|nr:hypothetical protein [Candidatus Dojkabacteria bacterium]